MIDRRPIVCWLAVVGAAAQLGGCGFGSVATGETRNDALSFDLGTAKTAHVELRMGSGELRVSRGTQKMMEGTFAYNVADQWDVRLNDEVALEVTANLGAGEAHLELGHLNLSRVEMNIGAGKVTMDLRGEPKRDYDVQIRGGVGETVVYLPKNAGISAKAAKGIGDISAEGLEQRDGVWINPDGGGTPVTVRLDVKGGVGAIRLMR
jgi:hypothetical protein